MSTNRKLVKKIHKFCKQLSKQFLFTIKKQIIWLLRTLFVPKRRRATVNAGFVLPTVAMVMLVVVLLTTAILFRSFDRSKNASNVRVNEAVLSAATPAIDRARAKLDALLNDPTLPRATPTDNALYDVLKKDKYTLGDETRLKLGYDIDGNGSISNPTSSTLLENDETIKTAWKFAVDTDNNGLKDSYTIYGIYFRNPTRDTSTGEFNRKRNPLETRTPPETSQQCGNAAGFSTLVGNSSWYKLQSGNLGKSFFVYTFNVPITQTNQTGYEAYKGNKSFAALEFQQDRSRVPLANNAAWFNNDLEITPGVDLLLNGRIHTNGNLLVGGNPNANPRPNITFRQVSSISSCFYNQENGQVSVGGNVGTGNLSHTSDQLPVTVDLYQGFKKAITTDSISSTNKSTDSSGGSQIGFNDAAYNQRIAIMKTSARNLCTNCSAATTGSTFKTAVAATSAYPSDIINNVKTRVQDSDDVKTADNILLEEIEVYLQNRTRRVPFAEISDATGTGATTGFSNFTTSIDPPADWRTPLNSSNQFTSATSITVTATELEATYPDTQKKEGLQTKLGDRTFVGNNLPALWLQNGKYVGSDANQLIYDSSNSAVNWTRPTGSDAKQRWRNTQVQTFADLGISERNGFWEQQAAQNPVNPLDNVGGVRIITGAGIYFVGARGPNTLPAPPSGNVWPDTMPMSSPNGTPISDLLMRATAVYHYKIHSGTDQEPIACVSSYYDPTDDKSIKNKIIAGTNLPGAAAGGKSNNGVVYAFPGRTTFTANQANLQTQANLTFPNGLPVNQLLKDALAKIGSNTTVPSTGLQLADYSAIDTALCAISILNNEANFANDLTNMPPHGAIKEASFLDAREVKQIGASSPSTTYDLSLEQRQPLEIRVTDIDLSQLASTGISSSSEYLLPYSGIIYASRDDASPDQSDLNSLLSPTDFKLDPTRRPNGIRLINGQTLARNPSVNNNSYNAKEKGLILVSNLPAYIKGAFNLHRTSTTSTTEIEEFTETEPTTNFYNRSTPNTNFACRAGRNGCPSTGGDYWRPATIIADSMTLLSGGFKEGSRSEGDYDLNNNTGMVVSATQKSNQYDNSTSVSTLDSVTKNRLKNGFWENNFVTSANWGTRTPTTTTLGSYTLNGVTPIQRRVNGFPEYLMEVCNKLPVYTCGPGDWYVDPSSNLKASDVINQTFDISTHKAGTTDKLAAAYPGYARRVAFKRNGSNVLQVDANNNYIPLGIDASGTIKDYPYTSSNLPGNGSNSNTLWFRTTNTSSNPSDIAQATYAANKPLFYYPPIDANGDGNPDLDGQPLLVPVLQIHDAAKTPPDLRTNATDNLQDEFRDNWTKAASADTTFNATFVVGNSPSRSAEDSAGLQNFVRFLEHWNGVTAKISGSFIQLKRSTYATAPIAPILKATATGSASNSSNLSLFNYPLTTYAGKNNSGVSPFYWAPNRKWGFDVGLLSEQPDLFAQRFTSPPTGRPNEFFREVSRDDSWIQALLCAGQASSSGTPVTYSAAVPAEYRPSNCLTIPND